MNYKSCLPLLYFFLFSVLWCSCEDNKNLKKTFVCAGKNIKELNKVIEHYKNDSDTLKWKAAMFLLENMYDHYSVKSEAIDEFVDRLHRSDTVVKVPTMNDWWRNELQKKDRPVPVYDAQVLSADFLIHEIDMAFEIWRHSRWHKEISFESFCQYVLPYRFEHEQLIEGWRDTLYRQYSPVIAEAKTMQEAFALIYRTTQKQLTRGSNAFPYIPNVLDMRKQFKASCMQHSVYLASVLRAVGLPVIIDQITGWANYSKNGHAWVALVTPEGTYTILEEDSVPQMNRVISSSFFPIKHTLEEDYPYPADFTKKVSKIYRLTFQNQANDKQNTAAPAFVSNNHFKDVSAEYGRNRTIEVLSPKVADYACLCTFFTGADWIPVWNGAWKEGKYLFDNMGDSVVYLPVYRLDDKWIPLDVPFLSVNGQPIRLSPNKKRTQRIVLTRKYPLIGTFMERWAGIRGACFEGSNDPDFRQKEVLHTIIRTPLFRNEIILKGNKAFRYIRYMSPKTYDYPMAEMEIWSGSSRLKGKPFIVNGKNADLCFDDDTFTFPDGIGIGYKIGIDLGEPKVCSRIVYYPKNDGNFIIPGHEYELFYYDKGWISLGKQQATDWKVIYDGVPTNALFVLKDRTKGDEERIFTYEDNKQIWW